MCASYNGPDFHSWKLRVSHCVIQKILHTASEQDE